MQMICISANNEEDFYGPYTDLALAERILKIVQLGIDPGAEMVTRETDQWGKQVIAGLLPWKVEITTEYGVITAAECTLTWPPEVSEGIVIGEEVGPDVEQVRYFAWAKTAQEAKLKVARLGTSVKAEAI